jgi:hypothetical protein
VSRRKSRWRYRAGDRGCTVTVYERAPGGRLYASAYDPTLRQGKGGYRRVSLSHRDRDRAKCFADEHAAKLRRGVDELREGRVTLADLLAAYERHRLRRKRLKEQRVNRRQAEMWCRFLGGTKDPAKITLAEWERFIDQRRAGEIDARGEWVTAKQRRRVRDRMVEKDLSFLRHVLAWGTGWRNSEGRYLLRENPVRGFAAPREKNPKRPFASQDRFEAIRVETDNVTMAMLWNGRRETVRSHLSEILDIVNGTGRRISAVCALRHGDLRLELSEGAPFGAVVWPAQTDKMGYETTVPIGPQVRAAIDRARARSPGIGDAPLFSAPRDPTVPVSRHVADKWLRRAEKLAGLETQDGSLWHAYRRKWVTERKHLPDPDVAVAGGWKNSETLRQCYQRADGATILKVVLDGGQLREVGT